MKQSEKKRLRLLELFKLIQKRRNRMVGKKVRQAF